MSILFIKSLRAGQPPSVGDQLEFESDRYTDKGPAIGKVTACKPTVDGYYVTVSFGDEQQSFSWEDLRDGAVKHKHAWLIKSDIDARYQRLLEHRNGGDKAAMAAEDVKFTAKAKRYTQPTPAQIAAGNYKKPRIAWHGMEIAIENPVGSTRSGIDPGGVPWSVKMVNAYGYLCRTTGIDGDGVDVFIGPDLDAPMVYVVHQNKVDDWDHYDEDKCMIGFTSQAAARAAYLSNYDDARFLGPITAMPVDEFVKKAKATYEKPAMIKSILFFKSHVKGYTKKDGTVVKPHEDKRKANLSGPRPQDYGLTIEQGKALKFNKPSRVPGLPPELWNRAGEFKSKMMAVRNNRAENSKFKDRDPLVIFNHQRKLVVDRGAVSDALTAAKNKSKTPLIDGLNVASERESQQSKIQEKQKEDEFVSKYMDKPIASVWKKDLAEKVRQAAIHKFMKIGGTPDSEARLATLEAIVRFAKKKGWEVEHTSKGGTRASSRYIKIPGRGTVRVSDHDLPMTQQREYNHSIGLTGRWDDEVVVDNWGNMSIEDYMLRLEHGSDWEEHKPMVKSILFFKSDHLSTTMRAKIGTVGSAKREDEPEDVFLEPGSRKYPVKTRVNGEWKYSIKLLEAAAARARMEGRTDLASRADDIRSKQ